MNVGVSKENLHFDHQSKRVVFFILPSQNLLKEIGNMFLIVSKSTSILSRLPFSDWLRYYLSLECFCRGNYRLIVAPQKFDFLKQIFCFEGKHANFKEHQISKGQLSDR